MNNTPRRARQRPSWWTLKRRRWAYGIAVSTVPVALAFGIGSEQQLGAILGLAAAVLGVGGLALANPTED